MPLSLLSCARSSECVSSLAGSRDRSRSRQGERYEDLPAAAEAAVAALSSVLLHAGGWLIIELVQLLWTPELAALAGTGIASCQLARRHWRQALRCRGFAACAAARLSPVEAGALERWGGQGWDVWRRQGKKPLTLLRHWEHGTTVVLQEASNGWFDYQVHSGDRAKVFYSTGSVEVIDGAGADLIEESGFRHHVDGMSGSHPLLDFPQDPFSHWRWSQGEDRSAIISFAVPGISRRASFVKRLRLTAGGMAAFGDGDGDKPCLVVERGIQFLGP